MAAILMRSFLLSYRFAQKLQNQKKHSMDLDQSFEDGFSKIHPIQELGQGVCGMFYLMLNNSKYMSIS